MLECSSTNEAGILLTFHIEVDDVLAILIEQSVQLGSTHSTCGTLGLEVG